MNKITIVVVLSVLFVSAAAAQTAKVSPNDLRILEGTTWTGGLTYLDYGSGKKTTIKSNVIVTRSPRSDRTWTFDMQYPLEPVANQKSEIILSPDGRTLDGEAILERTNPTRGVLRVVTSKQGKDNDRPATFRYTYLIGKNAFSIKKEVRIDGTDSYFERHTYTWDR